MGEQTAERLFRRLEQPELPPEEIVIPTRLVVRKTCGGSPEA
jgi:DNA-binding LacI/PurR family transcriptional regulator